MRAKQRRTLEAVFRHPTPADTRWEDVASLFTALGAELEAGSGSRVRVRLAGVRATFHRPHPAKEIGRLTIRDVRDFLRAAGFGP